MVISCSDWRTHMDLASARYTAPAQHKPACSNVIQRSGDEPRGLAGSFASPKILKRAGGGGRCNPTQRLIRLLMSRVSKSSSSPSKNSRRGLFKWFRKFGPTHSYSHLSTLERDSNSPGSVKKKSSTSSWVVHLPFFSSVTAATKSEKTASKRGAAVAQQAVAAAQTPSHSNHASPASRRRQLAQAQCEPVVIEPSSGYYYLGISPLFIRTCF
ncbi:hypothetical protein H4582DRAFT_745667 [Lactarius indigo]|nr:hypothetical protein H4582DRAFT_745667 [Lactarius indigo]